MPKRVFFRPFVLLSLFLIPLTLIGCLPCGLGDPSESKIDPKLTGYWLAEGDKEQQLMLIVPFDDHTYFIQHVGVKKTDGGGLEVTGRLHWKAWLSELAGKRFLSVDLLEQRLEKSGSTHAYGVLQLVLLDGDKAVTRLINDELETIKAAKSPEQLAAVIVKEMENPKLLRDPQSYRRLDPENEKDKELIDKAMKK